MRKLLPLLALLLATSSASAQVDAVFPGWRVYTAADSTISLHTTYHVALERAANWSAAHGGAMAFVGLQGPVRVTNRLPLMADTVWMAPDTVWMPLPPAPPVDTLPTEPPPDTIPPDTVPNLPPTNGATYVADWGAFPAGATWAQMDALSPDTYFGGGDAGGLGESRVVDLGQPGPWGGVKALENYYGVIPAQGQPQVGTYWALPAQLREMWLETWVKFGPTWTMSPDNPLYPGNVDHKLIFVMEAPIGSGGPFPARWECKVGVWWTTMPCSAHDHDTFYTYMKSPPSNTYSPATRLNATTAAWDGQWHRLRMYLRAGEAANPGRFMVWWDAELTVDSGDMDMGTAGRAFTAVLFGGNRNQGTDVPMSYFFGPGRVFTVNPGW